MNFPNVVWLRAAGGTHGVRLLIVGVIAGCALVAPAIAQVTSSSSGDVIRIPFEVNRTGLPTLNVVVNKAPRSVFLDYGGYAALAIKTRALAGAAVTFTGEVQRSGDAQGNELISRKFNAPVISAGSGTWRNVSGTELPESPAFRFPQDGYVGFALLRSYLSVFDYEKGELRLYSAGDRQAMARECGAEKFPIQVVDGVTLTKARVGYGERTFQFDTGSNMDLVRPRAVPGKEPKAGSTVTVNGFALGGSRPVNRSFLVIPYQAPDVDGVLGRPFFAEHVVCLDPTDGWGGVR